MNKTFQSLNVASLTSGVSLLDKGRLDIENLASHVLGTPIFSSSLVRDGVMQSVREELLRQFPEMPTEESVDAMGVEATCASVLAQYGDNVEIEVGAANRPAETGMGPTA